LSRAVDVIAEVFKREGIDRIFGIPGAGSTTDLIDAATKAGIETILTGHETLAALIASIYGEITQRTGVCFSITGPGATNLASGVAYAYLERSPLLAVTERHGADNYEFIATQKIDQKAFFAPITKGQFTITGARVQDILEKAFNLAQEERPGPVHLDLAKDAATAAAVYQIRKPKDRIRFSRLAPKDAEALRGAGERIENANFPVLVAGLACKRAGAGAELAALAKRLNAPVMVGLKGRGVFDEFHPLYGGVFQGTYARGTFEDAIIGKSDLLIFIGVDSVEFLPKPWGLDMPVLHIDFQTNIDGIYPAEMEIVGDIKSVLETISQHDLQPKKWDAAYLEKCRENVRMKLCRSPDDLPLHRIIQITREKLPSDGILATDVGAFNSMVHYLWQVRQPNTYFVSKGLSTMGFALPAAIAAQIALPDKKVVCFTGDGGFLMSLHGLEMCLRRSLPIIIVVFSDNALGLIKTKQKNLGFDLSGVHLKNPDLPMLVQAFGGNGFRVRTENEFGRALETAMNSNRLSLIEAVLNPETYGDHLKLIRG